MVKFDVEKGEAFKHPKLKWGRSKHWRKLQEEGVQEVSFRELVKLNLPDWYLLLMGIICSAIIGALFPILSVLFSEILRVGQSIVSVLSYIRVCYINNT